MGANTGAFTDSTTGKPWRVGVFTHFVAPQMRPQENFTLSTLPSVWDAASDGLRERLGFTAWHGVHGRVGGDAEFKMEKNGQSLPFMSSCGEVDGSAARLEPGVSQSLDFGHLRAQLDSDGYCVVREALGTHTVEALASRLVDQADAERKERAASFDSDKRQRVLTLCNKGAIYEQLLHPSAARELVGHVIGDQYLLSQASGILPGESQTQDAPTLCDTQWWMPQPIRHSDMTPTVQPGNAPGPRPMAADAEWQKSSSAEWIAPAASARVLWMLHDQELLLLPGSHLSGKHPPAKLAPGTVSVPVLAGSCVVLDGRTWYAPTCSAKLHLDVTWCGPQFRESAMQITCFLASVIVSITCC